MTNYCLLVSELVLSIVWCFMLKFTLSVCALPSDPVVLFVDWYLQIIPKHSYRKVLIFQQLILRTLSS